MLADEVRLPSALGMQHLVEGRLPRHCGAVGPDREQDDHVEPLQLDLGVQSAEATFRAPARRGFAKAQAKLAKAKARRSLATEAAFWGMVERAPPLQAACAATGFQSAQAFQPAALPAAQRSVAARAPAACPTAIGPHRACRSAPPRVLLIAQGGSLKCIGQQLRVHRAAASSTSGCSLTRASHLHGHLTARQAETRPTSCWQTRRRSPPPTGSAGVAACAPR